ncbi:hypothetical protein DRN67_01005 [Candidatus Micrarchaeota archaeon]|nr:MAG: hypothetical protein DRN67_01005 [Candidatus Micrarchaeota archaeon]
MSRGFTMGKASKFALVLLAALILLGCAGVPSDFGEQPPQQTLQEMLDAGHWQPIALTALMISFFIVALGWMLSEFLRSPELHAWSKNEIYEVLISAFLLASVFFFAALGEQLAQGFTMGENHVEWGRAYLDNVKTLLELEMYPLILSVDIIASTFATWNFSYPAEISALSMIIATSPVSGLQMIAGSLVFMLDSVGMFIAVTLAQLAFLDFAETFGLALFVPLGIVLRTFPVSRRLGSTLIALGITIYFIYPLTLALNQEVFDAAYVPLSNIWMDQTLANPNLLDPTEALLSGEIAVNEETVEENSDPGELESPPGAEADESYLQEHVAGLENEPQSWWQKTFNLKWLFNSLRVVPLAASIFFNANLLVPPIGWMKMFHDLVFRFYGPWLAQAAVLVLVLPVLDIIIAITFFRSLSLAIGGEPQIMGLTRIV